MKKRVVHVNKKIIIYHTEDGQTQTDVRLEKETVWLTHAQNMWSVPVSKYGSSKDNQRENGWRM